MPTPDSHFPYPIRFSGDLLPGVTEDTLKLLSHWISRGGGSDASDFAYDSVKAFEAALAVMMEIDAPYLECGPETHSDWHNRLGTRMVTVMETMANYVEFIGEGGNGNDLLKAVHEALGNILHERSGGE